MTEFKPFYEIMLQQKLGMKIQPEYGPGVMEYAGMHNATYLFRKVGTVSLFEVDERARWRIVDAD